VGLAAALGVLIWPFVRLVAEQGLGPERSGALNLSLFSYFHLIAGSNLKDRTSSRHAQSGMMGRGETFCV